MSAAARPRSSSWLGRLAGAALATVSAAGAVHAQATLPDDTNVVVTQNGLYRVPEGQPAILLFDPTAFGGGTILESPSVSWIPGTDAFIVTRRNVSGLGGVWRVTIPAAGPATVTDLTPGLPAGVGRDFADAEYSVGLDQLFLLERTTGQLYMDAHPATTTGATVVPWASLTPDTGVAMAVRGAHQPFSVLVVTATGEVLAVAPSGVTGVNTAGNPSWSSVSTDAVYGGFQLASQTLDKVVLGKADDPNGLPTALFSQNVWQVCSPLAQYPVDIVYDGRTQRIVALAGDFLLDCAFGPGATGKNHILRLPMVANGPPDAAPVLLTFLGDSGILGTRGDLALVRHGLPDVTWSGSGGSGNGSSAPLFGGDQDFAPFLLGQSATEGVTHAPPAATATLVIGLAPVNAQHQGQVLGPFPQLLLPTATGANGKAQLTLAIPSLAALSGKRVYLQWWFDDTTTPVPGDLVSSQTGIFTIGVP